MPKTGQLSRKAPTRDLGARTVVVEAGLPKDRLKGYEDDRTMFTGADARVALVGAYKKKNKKGFDATSGGKRGGGY